MADYQVEYKKWNNQPSNVSGFYLRPVIGCEKRKKSKRKSKKRSKK